MSRQDELKVVEGRSSWFIEYILSCYNGLFLRENYLNEKMQCYNYRLDNSCLEGKKWKEIRKLITARDNYIHGYINERRYLSIIK